MKPWFRIERHSAHVIAPHALAIGKNGDTASIHVDGKWTQIAEDPQGLVAYALGKNVLLLQADAVLLFSEGSANPRRIAKGECPAALVLGKEDRFVCVGCGERPPLVFPREHEPACAHVTASLRDQNGDPVWTRTAAWPAVGPGTECQGPSLDDRPDATGAPLLTRACLVDGYWKYDHFALTTDGFRRVDSPNSEPSYRTPAHAG